MGSVLLLGPVVSCLWFLASQDAPVGNWDGFYKTERLCQIPGPLWGMLLPITKVSPGTSSHLLTFTGANREETDEIRYLTLL